MPNKGPKLRLKVQAERLEHSATPWLIAIVFATLTPHSIHLPWWLILLTTALWLWSIWGWYQQRALPARGVLMLLVIAGTAGIGWEFRTLFGRDAGVALLALFMALKPLESRTRRDAIVVVMLGFFLLLTHYFYSQSIPTGLWLLGVSGLLCGTLIRLYGGAQPVRTILAYAARLLLQAIPLMLILFVFFPRITGPLWGLPQDAHSGLSGLSNQMSPGSMNNLIQSGNIAFRVQFSGTPPPNSQRYWRGPTLYDYDGRTWRAPAYALRAGRAPVIESSGAAYDYVTTLEAHNQRWLLALDLPTTIPAESRLSATLETLAKDPVRQRARFAFRSVSDYRVNREESPRLLEPALQLPKDLNPRTRALAQTWREKFNTTPQISAAALQLFRTEAFFYTLQPPLLGQHAIDDFLFTSRRGFCEHYAAAYVVLMRAAGIPARVVTGYQGGQINPIDGYFTVRQSDAHAWAEIWIAGEGWLRVDPTAAVSPARIEQGIDAALPASDALPAMTRIDSDLLRDLRNRWEAVNNSWNQWVIGYDTERQRDALARLGLGEFTWQRMGIALLGLSTACLLMVGLWLLYQRDRSDPNQRAWLRYCARLCAFGIKRQPWEGPFDFATRVSQSCPALGPLTHEAARHFAALHYGKAAPEQLQKLKQCIRRLPPPWKKLT